MRRACAAAASASSVSPAKASASARVPWASVAQGSASTAARSSANAPAWSRTMSRQHPSAIIAQASSGPSRAASAAAADNAAARSRVQPNDRSHTWVSASPASSSSEKKSDIGRSKRVAASCRPLRAATSAALTRIVSPAPVRAALDQTGEIDLRGDLRRTCAPRPERNDRLPRDHREPAQPREARCELLGDPVGEQRIGRVVAGEREGQHSDGGRRAGTGQRRRTGGGERLHGRAEAEAAAVPRLDHALPPAVVADGLARRLDRGRERGVGDDPPVPDPGEDLVLAEHPVAVLHEQQEQLQHLGLNLDGQAVALKLEPTGPRRAGSPRSDRSRAPLSCGRQNPRSAQDLSRPCSSFRGLSRRISVPTGRRRAGAAGSRNAIQGIFIMAIFNGTGIVDILRCPANGSCCNVASAWAASAVKLRRMSVTPAASQTFVALGTGITRIPPDQPCKRIGIVSAADPHPVAARDVDLDRAAARASGIARRRSIFSNRVVDDLNGKKAGTFLWNGVRARRKLRVTQPFEDDVRIQRVAPRHLRHGYIGRRRLEADRPLLLDGSKTLGSTRHRQAHSVRYPRRTLSDPLSPRQSGVPRRLRGSRPRRGCCDARAAPE